jgi:hypothetical protein
MGITLVTPNYSNTTWGSVVSVTHEGQTVSRPTPGATRTITHQADAGTITLVCPDPAFPDLVLTLGNRTWERTEPDVDPLWQQWVDAGLITEELLADLPEPQEQIDAREKAQREAAADTWYAEQVATGVQVPGTGFYLGIAGDDVALLTGLLTFAQTAVAVGAVSDQGPFTISDKAHNTHDYTLEQLTTVLLGYAAARAAISAEYSRRYKGE